MINRAAFEVLIGILLMLEGILVTGFGVVAVLSGALNAGLGGLVLLSLMLGPTLIWASLVLIGIQRPKDAFRANSIGKGAGSLTLIVGGIVAFIGRGILIVGACGGVNCPATMPMSFDTTPVLLLAFNTLAAALLWFKHPAQTG